MLYLILYRWCIHDSFHLYATVSPMPALHCRITPQLQIFATLRTFPVPPLRVPISDALFALAPDVAVIVETPSTLRGRRARASDETVGIRRLPAARGLERAEVEDSRDQGPEVGEVGDDDGGGGLAGVPVQVDSGAIGTHEAVDAVEGCAEDLRETGIYKSDGFGFQE